MSDRPATVEVTPALLRRWPLPAQAAVWAAHLHGRAGDRLAARIGRVGYLAREIADETRRCSASTSSTTPRRLRPTP